MYGTFKNRVKIREWRFKFYINFVWSYDKGNLGNCIDLFSKNHAYNLLNITRLNDD